MGSEPKEMKYRRRARVSEPLEYEQCGDRSGAVDWVALKQDPAELLRKLDEIRDQINRSCEMGRAPAERPLMSRRTVSLRPSHAEPPPPGRAPEYHRSRFAGRYEHGLPLNPYDQSQRSVYDERYARQPSGRFRQQGLEGQRESYGYGRHHSACQCAQCVHGPREEHIPMARYFAGQQHGSFQFERSPSISSEYDRRSVASSLYPHSHLSMSKRRVEYFRKKAESFCRPVKGGAPFVVCSSCNQLLQLPPGKCTARRQNQVRCDSCSEVISFKNKAVKVHPSSFTVPKSVTSSNRGAPQSTGWYPLQDYDNPSFSRPQSHGSQRQNREFSDNLSRSSTGSCDSSSTNKEWISSKSIQLKSICVGRSRFAGSPKDILCQGDADSQVEVSPVRTISPQAPILEDKLVDPFSSQQKDCSGGDYTRSKKYGLNSEADCDANVRGERIDMVNSKADCVRGERIDVVNSKAACVRGERIVVVNSKADCVRGERIATECEQKSKEAHKDGFGEESVDKAYGRKYRSGGNQFRRKKFALTSKADYDAYVKGERIDLKFEQKSTAGHKDELGEETIDKTYEQKCKQGNAGCHEDRSMDNKYTQKVTSDDSSRFGCEAMSKKYEEKCKQNENSFKAQGNSKRYNKCNAEDYSNALEIGGMTKKYEEESKQDDYGKSPSSDCESSKTLIESPVNEETNCSSRVSSEAELDEIQSSAGKGGDSSFFAGFLKKGFKDLSIFSHSVDSVKVSVNGHPISERALRKAEKKAGPVGAGSYWYDQRAGFWGVMGHECSGIIPPFIKEFSYSMPKDCAGGNTGVYVNGRELHQKDFDLLVKRGLPGASGKSYSVEISGNVIDDTTGKKLRNLGKLAPTIEKLKHGFGMHIPEEKS